MVMNCELHPEIPDLASLFIQFPADLQNGIALVILYLGVKCQIFDPACFRHFDLIIRAPSMDRDHLQIQFPEKCVELLQ